MNELMSQDLLGQPLGMWAAFAAIVVTLLALDLGVLHRESREIGVRESLLLSAGYIGVALLFGLWIWHELGAQSGLEYYTGFLIEQSLSIDNVFVIALILGMFNIPRQYQHRVLFWGVLGVIVLRAVMIGLGVTLVTKFKTMMGEEPWQVAFDDMRVPVENLVGKEGEGFQLAGLQRPFLDQQTYLPADRLVLEIHQGAHLLP